MLSPDRIRLDTDAAANYVGMSKSSLNKWRITGGGPSYIKLGRRVVYDVIDLDAWLRANRRRSTSVAEAGNAG